MVALGAALVAAQRPLVYGGGSKGIMGIVSGTVLRDKGKVTGIVPSAMVAAGGEGERVKSDLPDLDTVDREAVSFSS
jgi:predicted Rossmann-fold nucleotide-binding protein